ncbi:low molecular weight protein-tyrosine-phosphatase [Thermoactinomyces mirandus]|uniref:protein-tyrosine-phosphatase n=1 Tax=Thermoactinomyces mirandus TaxID=2756294 RepID=A0A7W1XT47_9BACL|nr:low molecular weight protein-tyrosine-phosphatase [Thermoactinomyces mirandus]MBA4602730.1 low molecular weight phosphotyrosine protein phosphatase [Thermoactinomyces mirandus]
MVSVLFVCLGNICRSPMAEAVFRHLLKMEDLEEKIKVDSAGIGNWHTGEVPHRGTRQKLKSLGISYEGLRARQVNADDFSKFTYIIGMDDSNVNDLRHLAGNRNVNIYRFVDFIPDTTYTEVPDPWYTGNFEETYDLVSKGCRTLLEVIKKEHRLS